MVPFVSTKIPFLISKVCMFLAFPIFLLLALLLNLFDRRVHSLDTFLKNASFLTIPSKRSQEIVQSSYPSLDIIVSNNGVKRFNRDSFSKLNSKIVFGYCGGDSPEKGFQILVKACETLNRHDYSCLLFGNYANQVELPRNMKYMGEYDSCSEVYDKIDILIVPSIWEEVQGLVIQEAIMSQTPVIASDIGGIPEFISSSNGWLVRPNDPVKLAQKMLDIIHSPDKLIKIKNDMSVLPSNSIEDQVNEFNSFYSNYFN